LYLIFRRFKTKPTSPPRSIVSPSLPTPTTPRNIIPSSPSERKRSAPEPLVNDSPPSKRLSTTSIQQENNHPRTTIGDLCSPPSNSHRTHNHYHQRPPRRRRSSSSSSSSSSPERKSPSRQNPSIPSSSSSMNELDWKNEVDKFLARTVQPNQRLPMPQFLPQPVPLLSLRPRYRPPPPPPVIHRHPPPPSQQPRIQRPRQPLSIVPKRPVAPVITPPIEQPPPNNISSVIIPNDDDDDENELLKTDVVDTFALIDEALFEADHLLELM
jgi:hypothetical protein